MKSGGFRPTKTITVKIILAQGLLRTGCLGECRIVRLCCAFSHSDALQKSKARSERFWTNAWRRTRMRTPRGSSSGKLISLSLCKQPTRFLEMRHFKSELRKIGRASCRERWERGGADVPGKLKRSSRV